MKCSAAKQGDVRSLTAEIILVTATRYRLTKKARACAVPGPPCYVGAQTGKPIPFSMLEKH